VVATAAFVLYTRTLLPGVDFGDTGGFQADVIWPETTARQAYPLYFALAAPFVRAISPDNPARGLNLFSAVWAGVAVGGLGWVVRAVSGSSAGALAAALFLAFSYTFWSQAVIAEVYTLHLACVAFSLAALHAFAVNPTRGRLAVFCAVYALAFGNHLSAILLLLPCAIFALMSHARPTELLRPASLGMALGIACLGSLLYIPNLLAAWTSIDAPQGWQEKLAAFWFDVTKVDWRETMLFGIDPSNRVDRLAMWGWDARQQFGLVGLALAVAGALRIWRVSRAWAVLLWLAYAINTAFAVTYNVGDAHVFFLPGHFFTAFAIGMALTLRPDGTASGPAVARRLTLHRAFSAAAICYALWSGWVTWPAADRHRDKRVEQFAARTLAGISPQTDVLVSRMNWDQENALLYATRFDRPDVPWIRLLRVLPHFPQLVADNHDIGRDVVLTAGAVGTVTAAYDGLFRLVPDDIPAAPPFSDIVRQIPRGTPYVLTLLTPVQAYPYDTDDVSRARRILTGREEPESPSSYVVVAGLTGSAPTFQHRSQRPFQVQATLPDDTVTIRIDGWVPTDTFRRGGFGHVIRRRQRVLFIERGASLVWFARDGSPRVAYAGGPYALQPRFRIPAQTTKLASARTSSSGS
jgi:hypothetical protein